MTILITFFCQISGASSAVQSVKILLKRVCEEEIKQYYVFNSCTEPCINSSAIIPHLSCVDLGLVLCVPADWILRMHVVSIPPTNVWKPSL